MSFPIEEYPLLEQLYWLLNTAGIGGVVVALLGGGTVSAFLLGILWIRQGSTADENDIYPFPTPALHHHEKSDEIAEEIPINQRGFRRLSRE